MSSELPNTAMSGAAQVTTAEPTDRVQSITTGRIHGTRCEAFEIVAGSTFDIPIDDPLVRFEAGAAPDETSFSVGVDVNRIDASTSDGNDVFIRGTYEDLFTTGKAAPTEVTDRVLVQTTVESCTAFSELNSEAGTNGIPQYATKYLKIWINGWTVMEEYMDRVLRDTIEYGHSVVMRLSELRSLFDAHETYTVNNDGSYVITDHALIDPDYYDGDETDGSATCETSGHGKGGNYHDEVHFLQHGECPAESCSATFDTFRSLRSHIGGKSTRTDSPEENEHDRTNLRLQELDVEASASIEQLEPADVMP